MIPANDAFQLSLKHEPSRLGLHSSSKLPFFSSSRRSQSPVSTRASPSDRSPMSTRRSSAASPTLNGNGDAHANGHSPQQPNGHTRTTAAKHARKSSRSAAKGKVAAQPQVVEKVVVDWEIPRKALHSSIGFLTLYLYYSQGSPRTVVVALASGLAIIVPCDILRLRSARFERLFEKTVGFLMRESERNKTNGVIWYIIGVMFALAVYPIDIAVVSILILSWADTTASTVGRLFGARTPKLPARLPILPLPLAPRKSVAGFAAAVVTGAAIAAGFWGWVVPQVGEASSWHWPAVAPTTESPSNLGATGGWLGLSVLGVVAGLISGITEALDLGDLDDNLTLPIISGGCLWGFFKLVEAFSA
ncbi:uncharacterized protein C8Q71DRAFT_799879 [Rhodofomes roseus]|uniref:Phosphatidate cytidylyltransferase n=1 Tax=Rhodofomes roseus TaxID=34475 RepID=A0ABQ8JY36_9APHY|nr:uncharacterized protein C8Q71DRAFT_799879 [Rhodofomes roseus]KAH9828944.1 hypothetical protein C8Q71DRAFT_799879 [Rhodofomes roseus]